MFRTEWHRSRSCARVLQFLGVALLALVVGAAPVALAHPHEGEAPAKDAKDAGSADGALDPLQDFFSRSKPTLDVRARWENADQTHLSGSNAVTLRVRLGLLSPEVQLDSLWDGFGDDAGSLQAFIEYEGTESGSKSSYFVPGRPAVVGPPALPAKKNQGTFGKTTIADPESHELNRAWLKYSGFDSDAKYGRQRIILDNARFVGNVGWRQNEQTFDAIRFTNNTIEDLQLDYTYIWQVNRIFGSQAHRKWPTGDFDSRTHLIHATFTGIPHTTVKVYGYFMKLETNFVACCGASNQVYGANLEGAVPVGDLKLGYYGEWARQSDYRDNPASYHATYYHVNSWLGYDRFKVGAGWEHLGEGSNVGFQTPLATLHKWNGWADVFLSTPGTGLVDRYAWVDVPLPFDVAFKAVYHRFDPDDSSGKFGEEYDFLLTKKLFWGVTGLAKVAFYDADISNHLDDPGTSGPGDNITRFWLELSYKFN